MGDTPQDLTIIFITLNKLPTNWREFHKKTLLEAADGAPIISISKEPLDFGENILQTEEPSMTNIYWQYLKGAKLAKTDFVAFAEDDTLYPAEHFRYRPSKDAMAYNRSRWVLPTWGEPFYFYKGWSGNCVAIGPRALVIEALEERFKKYEVFPQPLEIAGSNEKKYGLTRHKAELFFTIEPVVNLYHKYSHNPKEQQEKRDLKPLRAFDIPKWGRADKLREKFAW